jgi:uncharacterized protein (DUF1800 family)
MANRYLATDGNIRDVLETMFRSSEFWERRYYAAKFKTPYEYAISAARATGGEVLNVRPLAGLMAQLGMPLYGCQTPDGYKNTAEAWLNPDGMMMRLSFATALGAGRLPLERPVDFGDEQPMGVKRAMTSVAMKARWHRPTRPNSRSHSALYSRGARRRQSRRRRRNFALR